MCSNIHMNSQDIKEGYNAFTKWVAKQSISEWESFFQCKMRSYFIWKIPKKVMCTGNLLYDTIRWEHAHTFKKSQRKKKMRQPNGVYVSNTSHMEKMRHLS